MYWCKEKNRYVFPGNEDESEEEDTGPPPTVKKVVVVAEPAKPKESQGGASDLLAVALPAHIRRKQEAKRKAEAAKAGGS